METPNGTNLRLVTIHIIPANNSHIKFIIITFVVYILVIILSIIITHNYNLLWSLGFVVFILIIMIFIHNRESSKQQETSEHHRVYTL